MTFFQPRKYKQFNFFCFWFFVTVNFTIIFYSCLHLKKSLIHHSFWLDDQMITVDSYWWDFEVLNQKLSSFIKSWRIYHILYTCLTNRPLVIAYYNRDQKAEAPTITSTSPLMDKFKTLSKKPSSLSLTIERQISIILD